VSAVAHAERVGAAVGAALDEFARPYATDKDGQWVEACQQVNPETMFPHEYLPNNAQEVLEAKAVCAGCYFKDDCKRRALATNEQFGVWGGTTPKERHALLRRARRAGTQPETLFEVAS
jgi:WhiB family redox-sensing transcriptional regulator